MTEINNQSVFDVGMAGTTFRFLTALFSITEGERTLTGSERMKQRPISPLVDVLRKLGAEIHYLEKEGFPPLKITGKKLSGGLIKIDSTISSQFISALILIAPYLKNGLSIILKGNPVSMPYIDMTLKLMRKAGAKIERINQQINVFESN